MALRLFCCTSYKQTLQAFSSSRRILPSSSNFTLYNRKSTAVSAHVKDVIVDIGEENENASARDQRDDILRLDNAGHPHMDLSFTNAREAYRSKTTAEILRALLVFNLCSVDTLVKYNKQLMALGQKVLGTRLFTKVMKSTFYGHFVGGEDQECIKPVITRNKMFGVKSILDYSVEKDISSEEAVEAEMKSCVSENQPEHLDEEETMHQRFIAHEEFGDRRENVVSARTYFYEDEAHCEENMEIILNCIDAVSDATSNAGFAAIKLTALGRPQLLLQMSDVLVTIRSFFEKFAGSEGDIVLRRFGEEDFINGLEVMGIPISRDDTRRWFSILDVTQDGVVDMLDWDNLLEVNMSLSKLFVVPNHETGQVEPLVTALTEREEQQMKNMLRRINTIAEYATKKDVRVMVDAEQTYFQPAIRRLTMEMMRKFNKEKAVIFNTYQSYLKIAYDTITIDMDLAKRENFYFGAKLVRGAYMEQERERAKVVGYPDPINESFEHTTAMLYRILDEVMRQIHLRERGKIAVMVASHNEDTVRDTIQKMKEYNIKPSDRLICFGQLLGMCDQVSFALGQAGYSVYKYLPYGSVEGVLPYLGRRALENKGVITKVKKEKQLLWEELLRRLREGEIFYDPLASVAQK